MLKDLKNGLGDLDNLAQVDLKVLGDVPKGSKDMEKMVSEEVEKGLKKLNPFKKD